MTKTPQGRSLPCQTILSAGILVLVLLFIRQLGGITPPYGEAYAVDKGSSNSSSALFDYDKENWYQYGPPKIVIMAGPHKTASTTLQNFSVRLAAQKVSVDKSVPFVSKSHALVDDWVWALPKWTDFHGSETFDGSFFLWSSRTKLYATLAIWVNGDLPEQKSFLRIMPSNTTKNVTARPIHIKHYFRQLNRRVWEEQQKNILIGSEELDRIIIDLNQVTEGEGELLHFHPNSEQKIDQLLSVFQWESTIGSRPPPSLKDIEVHINLRSPRANHLVSVWHEVGKPGESLSKYLNRSEDFHVINSLAVALAFARKVIKTTVVDMAGLEAYANEYQHSSDDDELIGGLQGMLACNILRLDSLCDSVSQLRLSPPLQKVKDENKRRDKGERDISDEDMDEISQTIRDYDCDIWRYLRKYQAEGTLRILYPSKTLFQDCVPNGPPVSFQETTAKIRAIAKRASSLKR